MRKVILVALAASVLLAAPMAQAGSDTDRATGGGQVLLDTHTRGAGNTIAFTARNTADPDDDENAATGQVQYVDRSGGNGGASVRRHGTVVCLRVEGNTATLAGTWDRPAESGAFEILVIDNGEGAAAGNDIVTLQQTDDPTCTDEDDDDDGQTALARGNAQVYDADAP